MTGHMELVPSTNSLRQFAAALRLLAIVALFFAVAYALVFAIGGFASSHPAEGIVGLLLASAAGSVAALRLRLWLEVRRAGK
jgi:hypothetical protein